METHQYEAKLPLEIERKAFEELKEYIKEDWEQDINRYKRFKDMEERILLYINDNKVQRVDTLHICGRIFEGLFRNIFHELIDTDPWFNSIQLFNSVAPEDDATRKCIGRFLPDYVYVPIDLLKGKKIVKMHGKPMSGVPMDFFLVGQALSNLFGDFEHYRCIDAVKETGTKESIEELRNTRIYKTEKGTVWDYSPLIKHEFSKSGITVEVFTKEDFEKAKKEKESFAQKTDDILCTHIHEAYADPRENIYFGENLDSGLKYMVRYDSKEETIPIQLLPKYQKLMKKYSRKTMYTLTRLTTRKDIPNIKEDHFKEDEIQTARIGLLKGARTWNEVKGPATNWLKEYIKFELGHGAEKLSTEMMKKERLEQEKFEQGKEYDTDRRFQKKILMEDMESSGGRLDNPIEADEAEADETYKDLLKKEDSLEIEDKIVLLEILETEPRMENILKKQARGEPLTSNERQIYHRITNRLKKKYRKN